MLDSSAPAKKRGKEREGGKKKKLTKVKKIILKVHFTIFYFIIYLQDLKTRVATEIRPAEPCLFYILPNIRQKNWPDIRPIQYSVQHY